MILWTLDLCRFPWIMGEGYVYCIVHFVMMGTSFSESSEMVFCFKRCYIDFNTIDGLMQGCSISSVLAVGILQSC